MLVDLRSVGVCGVAVLAVTACLVPGCGSEDETKSPHSGGAGGTADASAGSAGVAGAAGTGGEAGTAGAAGVGGAAGLGGGAGVGGIAGSGGADAGVMTVEPLYPSNGPFWNDYVKADGSGRLDASDTACDPINDGPTYDACIHGGELRAAAVPGRSSCAGLSADDSLGALDWTCVVKAGQAWVISTGLKPAMHLADLLDFSADAWKEVTLTAYDGATPIATTQPAAWWTNPVRKLPTGTTTAAEHDVLITSAGSTGQIATFADKVAYVTEPGTTHAGAVNMRGNFQWFEPRIGAVGTLTISAGGFDVVRGADVTGLAGAGIQVNTIRASLLEDIVSRNHSSGTAVQFQVVGTRVARVTTASSLYGVVVGLTNGLSTSDSTFEDLTDTGSGVGIQVTNATTSSFKRLTSTGATRVTNNDGAIAVMSNVSECSFEDLTATDCAQSGIYIWGSTSTYRKLRIARVGEHGLALRNANTTSPAFGNRIEDVRISELRGIPGGGQYGLYLTCGWNVIQDVNISGADQGVLFDGQSTNVRLANVFTSAGDTPFSSQPTNGGGGAVMQNLTAVGARYLAGVSGSRGNAIDLGGAGTKYVGNALALNSTRSLNVFSTSAARTRLRNMVLVGSSVEAVAMGTTAGATFDGVLRMGSDAVGLPCVVPASALGLGDTCLNEAPSTATVTMGYLGTGVVVGPVASDASNPSHTAGQVLYAATLDLLAFDSVERAWGKTGAAAWPGIDQRGKWIAGDTLQIFDLSLLTSDTTARAIAPIPSGNDVIVMVDKVSATTVATQADCDKDSPGSQFVAGTPNVCQSTFLRDSVEVLFDGIGDDDNLCESNETCIYSPNAGAYQGHGNLISAGAFTNGTITGVTLLRYETNGR